MQNTEWPKDQITRIAGSSGKPLEVICAEPFLQCGWKARLGSHFQDGPEVRELDVLAELEEPFTAPLSGVARLRALMSCRGFPSSRSPLVYSVSRTCLPSFAPRLLSSYRISYSGMVETNSSSPRLEAACAEHLLWRAGLAGARPVVAFDVMERSETVKRNKPIEVSFTRVPDGDRSVFKAVDSCVKASLHWIKQDMTSETPSYFATLNVPVCVLSLPFWDVCIDNGKIAEPQIQHRGYQTNLFPDNPSPREVTTLLWAVDQIGDLVKSLNIVFDWFKRNVAAQEF